ncbi:uncharacterized protein BYT42DRAFT_579257 [Radiomyces spectabilis]|uniref:uncharacterized protein n=1 Tax=Radiomyces spectabilis TaxID=64574 RepID=UPI00221EB687|nr:uncharacterized protein BYT42DRAFT_579257 [Radiomyces spectabilis]KAI8373116.1 hypothetical protein BYT42DRAFT_579257 [Radiomyces spectabilis]
MRCSSLPSSGAFLFTHFCNASQFILIHCHCFRKRKLASEDVWNCYCLGSAYFHEP